MMRGGMRGRYTPSGGERALMVYGSPSTGNLDYSSDDEPTESIPFRGNSHRENALMITGGAPRRARPIMNEGGLRFPYPRDGNANSERGIEHCNWTPQATAADQDDILTYWLVDSGASSHMTARRDIFVEYEALTPPVPVTCAGQFGTAAVGRGTVFTVFNLDGGQVRQLITGVLHIPNLGVNLFSMGVARQRGQHFISDGDLNERLLEVTTNTILAYAWWQGTMLRLDTAPFSPHDLNSPQAVFGITTPGWADYHTVLWHIRLGHISNERLVKLSRGIGKGIPKIRRGPPVECEACTRGKSHRKNIGTEPLIRAQAPLQRIHADLAGPIAESIGGTKYYFTIVDDYSRYGWITFLKTKDLALQAFRDWITKQEKQLGLQVYTLRTDNGGEFLTDKFERELADRGIERELTAPHTPQHNGVAERRNRTTNEMTRCMLAYATLPERFWAEGVQHANEIINRIPTDALTDMTPFEALYGIKADVSRFRTFGCKALALNENSHLKKFEDRTKEYIYLGPSTDSSAHRLWDETTRRITLS
jgi:transposase InsO family protein